MLLIGWDIWDDDFGLEIRIWVLVFFGEKKLIINQRLKAFRDALIFIFALFNFSAPYRELFYINEGLWCTINLLISSIIITCERSLGLS